MRIHAVYHVPFEGLGYISNWIKMGGYVLSETHVYQQESLPDIGEFDMLVIMGGPMNVYEEQLYPWLKGEKILIRKAIDAGKYVLGICFGAQLIALVLNCRVFRNKMKEIGWFPVHLTHGLPLHGTTALKDELVTFHWHGDTFDLPEKAKRLAYSEATRNQAFLYEDRVLAIQFHPEVLHQDIRRMIMGSGTELRKEVFVQTSGEMTAVSGYYEQNHVLLGYWLAQLVNNTLHN